MSKWLKNVSGTKQWILSSPAFELVVVDVVVLLAAELSELAIELNYHLPVTRDSRTIISAIQVRRRAHLAERYD